MNKREHRNQMRITNAMPSLLSMRGCYLNWEVFMRGEKYVEYILDTIAAATN